VWRYFERPVILEAVSYKNRNYKHVITIFIQIISRYMRDKESLAREYLASNLILTEPGTSLYKRTDPVAKIRKTPQLFMNTGRVCRHGKW
jgi:hypothetical protein